jgi:cytochrome c553
MNCGDLEVRRAGPQTAPLHFAARRIQMRLALGVLGALWFANATPAFAQTIEEKAEICGACHGEKGIPQEKTTPIIWGQHVGFTYLTLRDYKSGARKNDLMQGIVADLEREEMLALAEYFAKKPWPRTNQPSASHATAREAETANISLGCTGCHQAAYMGEGTQPRLAGQQREYLANSMTEYRNGERTNNPGMTTLMKAMAESAIDALAQYLAGLR